MKQRVLVCGGRDYSDADTVNRVLSQAHAANPIEVLIYGMARGADDLAKMWAATNGVTRLGFPANWEKHGRAAGPMRNQRMLEKGRPDLVIAFPGGRGTADMVKRAKDAKVPVVTVHTPREAG